MRAFASSSDQTRPTIILHGEELAIGPASTDPHGEWGIHVQPPVDGRAQELREALQLAAKLLAGSKGNPSRLQDEQSELEDRATNNWNPIMAKKPSASRGNRTVPGKKPAVSTEAKPAGSAGKRTVFGKKLAASTGAKPAGSAGKRTVFGHDGSDSNKPAESEYYEPAMNAPTSSSPEILSSGASRAKLAKAKMRKTPPFWADVYERPELEEGTRPSRMTSAEASSSSASGEAAAPAPTRRAKRPTVQYNGVDVAAGAKVAAGAASTASPAAEVGPRKKKAAKTAFGSLPNEAPKEAFAATASKTMPIGLTLDNSERLILNELGKHPVLTASAIGRLLNSQEPMEWMSCFMDKLAEFGLDLVSPAADEDGEPTYMLIR